MPGGSGHSHVTPLPQPHSAVVMLPAEVDVGNHRLVEDELVSALSDGLSVLVADGTRTTFCDSSGMAALVRVHLRAVAAGTELRIAASLAVRRVLELTAADDLLDIYPSLAEAVTGRHLRSVP
jgi:anti-sigma B factor antagonist